MTADEFYDFVERPENRARSFELVREVIEVSRRDAPHGFICGNAKTARQPHSKGYIVSNDTGVILERDPDTVRGPDVAYYEDVVNFDELPEKWGDIAPRLAIEVLSPNDLARYITEKINDYLDNGVELVWVIDPESRTVTIYSKTGVKKLTEKDTLTGGDVLPSFRCKVSDLFVLPETTKAPSKKMKRKREK